MDAPTVAERFLVRPATCRIGSADRHRSNITKVASSGGYTRRRFFAASSVTHVGVGHRACVNSKFDQIPERIVNTQTEVLGVLEGVLNLRGRTAGFGTETALLGSIPELDSMAVVSVITSLEERFGFSVEDDELDGSTFATVGSLVQFVEGKLRSA